MNEILDKYREMFGEQFPLMLCRSMTDDEIIEIVQKSIDEGEPYEPELDADSDY